MVIMLTSYAHSSKIHKFYLKKSDSILSRFSMVPELPTAAAGLTAVAPFSAFASSPRSLSISLATAIIFFSIALLCSRLSECAFFSKSTAALPFWISRRMVSIWGRTESVLLASAFLCASFSRRTWSLLTRSVRAAASTWTSAWTWSISARAAAMARASASICAAWSARERTSPSRSARALVAATETARSSCCAAMSCCWSATWVAANRWLSTRSSWISWSRAARRSSMRAKAGCAAEARRCCARRPSSREDAGTAAGAAPGARPRRGGLGS
uniref:Uncharacterized protein n=1 Tax=Zea mays TaxID=4577 RepID=C0P7S2_MAIZE|nr:unknown [Zea mays]